MSDAVVHTADSGHRSSVDALLRALRGTDKVLIHTSGSGIVGDDARGEYEEEQIYWETLGWRPDGESIQSWISRIYRRC